MLDLSLVGKTFHSFEYEVERGQIRALADVLGDTNPLYHDVAAARAAGFPDLPVPPTLPTRFGLWANGALLAELDALGAPLPLLLHGEQEYEYLVPVFPGDTLTSVTRIASIREKQGSSGPFQLLTLQTALTNQRGELALTDRLVVVVRSEAPPADDGRRIAEAPPAPPPPSSTASGPSSMVNGPSSQPAEEVIPGLVAPPIIHNRLVRYSGASADYNPLHTDAAFARAAGLADVIAHGMLVMGYTGRMLSDYFGPGSLRRFGARFSAVTNLGDEIRCAASTPERIEVDGRRCVRGKVQATDQYGQVKLSGTFEALDRA